MNKHHKKCAYFASFASDRSEMNSGRLRTANIAAYRFEQFGHCRTNWTLWNIVFFKVYLTRLMFLVVFFIPLLVIPTCLHRWNRQYWHWFRVDRTITHCRFLGHLYLASSPFTFLRKNFLHISVYDAKLWTKIKRRWVLVKRVYWHDVSVVNATIIKWNKSKDKK